MITPSLAYLGLDISDDSLLKKAGCLQLASVKTSPFAEDLSSLKFEAEQTIAGVFKALFDQLGVRLPCHPFALNIDSPLGRQSAP